MIASRLHGELSTCQDISPEGHSELESNSVSFAVQVLDPLPDAQNDARNSTDAQHENVFER